MLSTYLYYGDKDAAGSSLLLINRQGCLHAVFLKKTLAVKIYHCYQLIFKRDPTRHQNETTFYLMILISLVSVRMGDSKMDLIIPMTCNSV